MSNTLNACAVISLDCLLNCSAYGAYVEVGNVVLVDVTLLLPAQFLCAAKTLLTNSFVICKYSCCRFEIDCAYCGWNLDIPSVTFNTPCLYVSNISELSCAMVLVDVISLVLFVSVICNHYMVVYGDL